MTPPPIPPPDRRAAKTNDAIEERIGDYNRAHEQRRIDQAMNVGPWEQIERLRNECERLRGCLREVMQKYFELREQLAHVEKPVKKPCASSTAANAKRRQAAS